MHCVVPKGKVKKDHCERASRHWVGWMTSLEKGGSLEGRIKKSFFINTY